jgi:DNA-binding NarL/FixJ family response regulator
VHTLVVCETEPIAIEGLRNLLTPSGDFHIVAATTSLEEAIEAANDLTPSLLLVDKAFGIHAVMDCIKRLRDMAGGTAAIVWGVLLSEAESLRFLQAGAAGVVRKTAALNVLLHCLRAVAAGGSWMEHDDSCGLKRPPRADRSVLTAREMQVRELVERGLKNKDIALALGIRTGTVKIHLKHVFEKTGIHGRYGLALSGLKEKGLLTLPGLDVM